MRVFLDNIELWLSAAGLVVILAVPRLLGYEGDAAWQAYALTAVGVGALHGLIFWVVRRRQRLIRRQVIGELRAMLRDRVNNNLTVITMSLPDSADAETAERVRDLHAAVGRMSELVGTLSDESLSSWQQQYADTVATLPRV